MHRCLDEELVVRIAAGLVPAVEAHSLIAEVELCPHCLSLLSEAGVALKPPDAHREPPVFEVGEHVAGRYEILRFIGRGGMGEVFEARDSELHERVALKTIRSELSGDLHVVNRFKQEMRLARKVIHPNVARVFDLGTVIQPGGLPLYYQTMELIEGKQLSHWLDGKVLPITVAVNLAHQMAAGLAAIHEQGIVHRDFKPENVMVHAPEQSLSRVSILDFGIARSRDRLFGLATTGKGVRLGTPDYMAPEVLQGRGAAPASDVFSFGLVIYELLTGTHPCPNPGTRAVRSALKELTVQAPSLLRPAIPPGLSRFVVRCLDNVPEQRPATGADLLKGLQRLDEAGRELSVAGTLWKLARTRLTRT